MTEITKDEFIERWNSNDEGGGITFDDVAECAVRWGICSRPKIRPPHKVLNMVLRYLGLPEQPEETDTEGETTTTNSKTTTNPQPPEGRKENKPMTLARIIKGIQPEPFRLLVHGTEGIGKSTFAAQSPDPIFIQTEDGLGQIDAPKFPLAQSLQEVKDNLDALLNEQHDYKTVVIDSLDWLEKLIVPDAVAAAKLDAITEGYGKGYAMLASLFHAVIDQLNRLRRERKMNIIFIAHTKMEKVENPSGGSYDQFAPKADKRVTGIAKEWVDIIGFAHRKVTSKDEKGKAERPTGFTKESGCDRFIRFDSTPAIVAKNRYSGLPEKMPLDGEAFFTALWSIIHHPNNEEKS
ncbi:MAG: ATP-binding protein [Planctomycetaceae bacterium]|nr:ATP-binding protein [Planctomycetaceae bacterium]